LKVQSQDAATLRFGFLPSDFHPMILFLGEAEALRKFAQLLRSLPQSAAEIALERSVFCAPVEETSILLTQSGDEPGMRVVPHRKRSFIWTVEDCRATALAEMVEELAEPGRKSGSAMLECGSIGETPVKVSRGEYTDDFLRGDEYAGR
jgi:hypothetical protein